MKFKNFIIFTLTFLTIGCDGSYQSNDDEMVTELNTTNSVKFVAVGESGTILTSNDGRSWTFTTVNTDTNFKGITYGNNIFVTVGNSGIIYTSSDGKTWTLRRTGISDDFSGVKYVNNTFIAVGGAKVWMSTNGISWDLKSSGFTSGDGVTDATFGNNLYAVVINRASLPPPIYTSSDGNSWTARTSGIPSQVFYGITYGNNIFVAVGSNGTILTSSDGISWTSRTSGTSSPLNGVTIGNDLFVTIGATGTILSSSDGTSWNQRTSGVTNQLKGLTFGNNIFLAVGVSGTILTSSDGISWISSISGISYTLNGVTSIK